MRGDGGLATDGEKWVDLGCVLEAELTGPADGVEAVMKGRGYVISFLGPQSTTKQALEAGNTNSKSWQGPFLLTAVKEDPMQAPPLPSEWPSPLSVFPPCMSVSTSKCPLSTRTPVTLDHGPTSLQCDPVLTNYTSKNAVPNKSVF